jgi:hypothetical protein
MPERWKMVGPMEVPPRTVDMKMQHSRVTETVKERGMTAG